MEELIARNRGLIPPSVQEKIGEAKVLLVGCGLGSQIAVLAARTGFFNFDLRDGDNVEAHNLNRQAFNWADIGQNKAEITARLVKAINPKANVETRPRFLLDREEIAEAVKRADIVINTADPDEAMYWISEIARTEEKAEFHPLNIGWMAYCLALTPKTPSLEEIVGGKICGLEFYHRLIEATLGKVPLPEGIDLDKILSGEMAFPQLGPTSYVTAALVVTAVVRWLAEDATLPVAPKPLFLNCWA